MITPNDTMADTIPDTLRTGAESLLSPARRRLVALATSYVGCHDTTDRDRYLALICGPGDQSAQAHHDLEGASGCALTVRGLWRLAGLMHPILTAPYVTGHAMQDLEAIARETGAWVEPKPGAPLPMPGDAVILASPTGGHAYTVLAVHVGERTELETVDGGQRDAAGRQWVARMTHMWTTEGGGIVDRAYSARRVHGFVNVDKLRWGET